MTHHPRLAERLRAQSASHRVSGVPEELLDRAARADAAYVRQPGRAAPRAAWQPALLVAAAVLALLALAAGGAGTLLSGTGGPSEFAGSVTAEAAIPDRLETPSPWLPVDETPGRAAVVLPGEHRTLFRSTEEGAVVVSATTGAYSWLPLPDLADAADFTAGGRLAPVALSPDGRLLAFWRVTRGDDYRTRLLIRDLVTGRERPASFPAATTTPSQMLWEDARTLAFVTVDWSVTAPDVGGRGTVGMSVRAVRWPTMQGSGPDVYSPGLPVRAIAATGGVIYVSTDDGGRRLRPSITFPEIEAGDDMASLTLPRGAGAESVRIGASALSGTVVAAIDDGGVEITRSGASESIPQSATAREIIAIEATQSLVVRAERASREQVVRLPFPIQFGGGQRQRLLVEGPAVRPSDDGVAGGSVRGVAPSYASDLWAVPTVSRPAPEEPTSPRLLAGLGAGGVALLLAVGMLALRRRRA